MNRLLIIILILGFSQLAVAQCNGNLGENIFTDGDFGSGVANILTPDPQIAPGYTYESNPPPIDGTYSITNNTTSWGNFADPNWANIGDNSPDPNGYMMIVNASYDPGLFYEQQINDLCENTLYVFSVDIYNLAAGIQPNVSFLVDGTNIFDSGDIPLNNQWNTYEATFTTGLGQNSVTFALQNNAPGGNGNDLALDNISFRACGPEATISPSGITTVCPNESIDLEAIINGTQFDTPQLIWQQSLDEGITWTNIPGANVLTYTHTDSNEGTYYYRYLLANSVPNLINGNCSILSDIKIINVVGTLNTNISATSIQLVAGESSTITISGAPVGSTFSWSADNDINPTGNESVIVTPSLSTNYLVTITSPEGCEYFDSIFIEVIFVEYSIPNAFTPNNDGLNDNFFPIYNDFSYEILEFKVFDRWGELVHDSVNTPWDGTFNAKKLPSDIYVYFLRIRYNDGNEEFKKGDVALMR